MTPLTPTSSSTSNNVSAAPAGSGSGRHRWRLLDRMSLRSALVGAMVLLVATGLLASGVAVAATMRGQLVDRVDQQLTEAANGWARQSPAPDGDRVGSAPGAGGPSRPSRGRPPSEFFVGELDADGALTITVNDEDSAPVLPNSLPLRQPVTVSSADGDHSWRVMVVETGRGRVVVGLSMDEQVDRTLGLLVLVSAAVGALVLALVGAIGWYLVSRALRPLREVEVAAREIAAGTLDRRLPDRPPGTEVGELTRSFNDMIQRLEQSFADTTASEEQAKKAAERLRRFAADASHELRTPLTSIRGFAELHRMGAMPDSDTALTRIEAEAVRMSALVEDLLTLTRGDAEQPVEVADCELSEVVREAVDAVRATAPERRIEVDAQHPVMVHADSGRIRQVVVNLVANAVIHTPGVARVWVTLALQEHPSEGIAGPHAVVTVTDNGNGMSAADAERVFDRFYRADSSRSRAGGAGSGLGLAIVADIVTAHGGTVDLHTAPGAGATFIVRLPLGQ